MKVVTGQIVEVDVSRLRVNVYVTEWDNVVNDVPIPASYVDNQGASVISLPEVGSTCWLLVEEGKKAVLLSYTGQVPIDLQPGDIYLGTRFGNRVYLRRNGVIEIGYGMGQRVYVPTLSLIRDIFLNYEAVSPGGNIEWAVRNDGSTSYVIGIKRNSDDNYETVVVSMGDIGGIAFSVQVYKSEDSDATALISITPDGQVDFKFFQLSGKVVKDADLTFEQNLAINVVNQLNVKAGGIVINSDGTVMINSSTNIGLQAGANLTLSAGQNLVIDAPSIVAGGPVPLVLASALSLIKNHTHPVSGSATGTSIELQALDAFKTQKLKGG